MSATPQLFLPIIPPPDIDQSDPASAYAAVGAQVTVDDTLGGNGLQITIGNPDATLPASHYANPLPLSTVCATARGFVTFYPSNLPLPTPDGKPITIPPEMAGLDIGTIIENVWPADHKTLDDVVVSAELPPTHIAYLCVDRLSVQAAFTQLVTNVPTKALAKSWIDTGGSGSPPDLTTLRNLFVQRAMTGAAAIYVTAGSPLGKAAKISIVPSGGGPPVTAARFILQTYSYIVPPVQASPPPPQSTFCDPESMPDDIYEIENGSSPNLFEDHPLVAVNDSAAPVFFKSQFLIWDSSNRSFTPLPGREILLHHIDGDSDTVVATGTTATDGTINISASLARRDQIQFEVDLTSAPNPIANRTYLVNLKTAVERVKKHLDATRTNTNVYRLKYRVAHDYRTFYLALRANVDNEPFQKDRGSTEAIKSIARLFPNFLMRKMDDFEDFYAGENAYAGSGLPSGEFNILFEGDSWLSYPIGGGDVSDGVHLDDSIFVHFNRALAKRLKKLNQQYNRIPLQHHGDRSDQMFGPSPPDGTPVQWTFTQNFLDEYKFNLIVLSAGGNDIAEPGMSDHLPGPWLDDFDEGPITTYPNFYTNNVFDPNHIDSTTSDKAMFDRRLGESFAALLKNHPWNFYLRGSMPPNPDSAAVVKTKLDAFLSALNLSTTVLDQSNDYSDDDVKAAGAAIINALKNATLTFPDSANDPYNQLLAAIFDKDRMSQRYTSIRTNIETLLAYTEPRNINVLTHTYCYPMFQQVPTMLVAGGIHVAGPWFRPRFLQANIQSWFVRMICLKALIDIHVQLVLGPLKKNYSHFNYVDLRGLNQDPLLWHDELHLTNAGFATAAQAILDFATANNLVPQPPP